jgi:hypothetical protein
MTEINHIFTQLDTKADLSGNADSARLSRENQTRGSANQLPSQEKVNTHKKVDDSGRYGRSESDGASQSQENRGDAFEDVNPNELYSRTKLDIDSKPSEKQSSADGVIDLAKDDIFKGWELTQDRSFRAIHITLPGHFSPQWASAQPHLEHLAE